MAQDGQPRGRDAERPTDIPKPKLKNIAVRVKDEVKRDRVPLVSAGVAFYAMLALFPAMTAAISVYGLFADPQRMEAHIAVLTGLAGGGAGELVAQQAESIVEAGRGALTFAFFTSLVLALWTASSGMHGLMQALTIAYDEEEMRGFVKRRAIALALTLLGIAFFALAVGVIVVVPIALELVGLGQVGEWVVRVLRWPFMAAVLIAMLAAIYRYAPHREKPRWRWTTPGAVIAGVLWVLASLGFSFYVSNFGTYNETYGAIGAVIVLLLWLFLSAFIVVLGAEINAETEHQTTRDSTDGEPEPMGRRGAHVADTVGRAAAR